MLREGSDRLLHVQELHLRSPKREPVGQQREPAQEQQLQQQEQHQAQQQQDHAPKQQQQLQEHQELHSPKQQAFERQQPRQEQWQLQQQMCGLPQRPLPTLQQQLQLSRPSQQQRCSFNFREAASNSVFYRQHHAATACASERQQRQQQPQTPWQQQQQQVERLRQQQEHCGTMLQQYAQQQHQDQQQTRGESSVNLQRGWELEGVQPFLSSQQQQSSTADLQHPTAEQQHQGAVQKGERHRVQPQQQALVQQRWQGGESDMQQQTEDKASAALLSFAVGETHRKNEEGEQQQQLVDNATPAGDIPDAHATQHYATSVLLKEQSWQMQLLEQQRHRQLLLQKQHHGQQSDDMLNRQQLQQLCSTTPEPQFQPQHQGDILEEKLLHALSSETPCRPNFSWKHHAEQQQKASLFEKEVLDGAVRNLSNAGSGEPPASSPSNIHATVTLVDALEQDPWEDQQKQTKQQLQRQEVRQQRALPLPQKQQKPQLHSPHLQERDWHQERLQQEQKQLSQERQQQQLHTGQWQQSQEQYPRLGQLQQQQQQHQQKTTGEKCSVLGLVDELRPAVASTDVSSCVFLAAEKREEIHILSTAGSLAASAEDDKLVSGSFSCRCRSRSSDSSSHRSSSSTHFGSSATATTETALSGEIAENHDHRDSRCNSSNKNSNHSSRGCTCSGGHLQGSLTSCSSANNGSPASSSSSRSSSTGRSIQSRSGSSSSRCAGVTTACSGAPFVDAGLSTSSSSFATRLASTKLAASYAATSHIQEVAASAVDSRRSGWRGRRGQQRTASYDVFSGEERFGNSRRGRSSNRGCARRSSQRSSTSNRSTDSRTGLRGRISSKHEADDSMSSREAARSNRCNSSRAPRGSGATRGPNTSNNSRSCGTSHGSYRSPHGGSQCSSSGWSRSSSYCSSSYGSSVEQADLDSTALSSRLHSSDTYSSSAGEALELLACSSRRNRRKRKMNKSSSSPRCIRSRRKRSTSGVKGRSGRRVGTFGRSGNSSTERTRSTRSRESSTTRRRCSRNSRTTALIMRHFNMLVDTLAGASGSEEALSALPAAEKTREFFRADPQRRQQEEQQGQQQRQHHRIRQQHRQHRHLHKQWERQSEERQQQCEHLFSWRGRSCSSEEGRQSESVAVEVLDRHACVPLVEGSCADMSCRTLLKFSSINSTSNNSSVTRSDNRKNSGICESASNSSDDLASSCSDTVECLKGRGSSSSREGDICNIQREGRGRCTGAGDSTFSAVRSLQSVETRRTGATGDADTKAHGSDGCSLRSGDSSKETCSGKEFNIKSGSRFTGELLQHTQHQHGSSKSSNNSSRTAERATRIHRRRFASSSRASDSLAQHSHVSSSSRSCSARGIEERHFGSSTESGDVHMWDSSHTMQHQHQREKHTSSTRKVVEAENLSSLKYWAMETFDILPDAWVVGHIDAVATSGPRGSPACSSVGVSHPADPASRLLPKRNASRVRNRVHDVGGEPAEAATPIAQPHAAPAAAPRAASAVDTAAEGKTAGETASLGTATPPTRRAAPVRFPSGALSAPAFTAAAPTTVAEIVDGAAAAPAAAAAETSSENDYLLQEYTKRETVAAAAAARKTRQEAVKSVIRQQLLQQYSNMLQQLQQHKAAAQLVQDESEPLRAALVRVVAAEAKLKKLQHSERWRVHVGALIHDADNDLVEFMAHFGTPADELSLSMVETAGKPTRSRKGRRQFSSFLVEDVVVEGREEGEENEEDTDQEEVAKTDEEEDSLSGRAVMLKPLFRLLVRSSNSGSSATSSICSGKRRTSGKSGSSIKSAAARSRARLLLKFIVGYVLLCGSVFLWLRHTLHQL